MLRPQGKPTAREMAQGFLVSLESETPLTDLEKPLIEKHRIDENKYRWEARYLEVAATEYAFYSLVRASSLTGSLLSLVWRYPPNLHTNLSRSPTPRCRHYSRQAPRSLTERSIQSLKCSQRRMSNSNVV